jgi:hypothetical protein
VLVKDSARQLEVFDLLFDNQILLPVIVLLLGIITAGSVAS